MTGCVVGVGCVVGSGCVVEVGGVVDTGRLLTAVGGTVPEPTDGTLTDAVWALLPGSARATKADSAPPPTIAPTANSRLARRILYRPTSRAERDNIIPSVRTRR
jgi:carbonic anhydrase/acetyltransferase-like protein (isoleucine patch superfamily)